MSIQDQGHFLTLVQGHTGPFVTKFHMTMLGDKKMKINKYELDHMTNMATMPI